MYGIYCATQLATVLFEAGNRVSTFEYWLSVCRVPAAGALLRSVAAQGINEAEVKVEGWPDFIRSV